MILFPTNMHQPSPSGCPRSNRASRFWLFFSGSALAVANSAPWRRIWRARSWQTRNGSIPWRSGRAGCLPTPRTPSGACRDLRFRWGLGGGSMGGLAEVYGPSFFGGNVDPKIINPVCEYGGVTGFCGDSSLLEGNTPVLINRG